MSTRKNRHSDNAIVIVEPRKHEKLKAVLDNYDSIMDSSWDLYLFFYNRDFALNAVKDIKGRRIFLKKLHKDNLTSGEYNHLFKQKKFWERVNAENILVLQTDAVLCGNSKFNIYDFTKYDYIGCSINNKTIGSKNVPWWWRDWKKDIHVNNFYGVGGMSFRKRSFMLDWISKNPNIDDSYPEDVFYSEGVSKSKRRPKTVKAITNFCSQGLYTRKSFGVHKILNIGDKQTAFTKYCPEIKLIGTEKKIL